MAKPSRGGFFRLCPFKLNRSEDSSACHSPVSGRRERESILLFLQRILSGAFDSAHQKEDETHRDKHGSTHELIHPRRHSNGRAHTQRELHLCQSLYGFILSRRTSTRSSVIFCRQTFCCLSCVVNRSRRRGLLLCHRFHCFVPSSADKP